MKSQQAAQTRSDADQAEERRWVALFRSLRPDLTPSDALTRKVRALAVQTDAKNASRLHTYSRSPSRRFLAGVFASVLLVAAITAIIIVGPRIALASTLRKVATNLRRADGLHYRVTFFHKGRETLSSEVWMRGDDRWRLEINDKLGRHIQTFADGKFWMLDPTEGVATYQKDTGPSLSSQSAQMRAIRLQIQQALNSSQASDLGTVSRGGRMLQQIAVPSPVQPTPFSTPTPGRTLFLIDRARMLPTFTYQQIKAGERWETVTQTVLDLEQGAPASVFTIDAKTVRVYDLDAYGQEAGQKFAQPLASKKFAMRTITLRDVQINRDGDVFVLYTDGSTPKRDRETGLETLQDDWKTVYAGTAGATEPYMYIDTKGVLSGRGMVVDGQIMKGVCWTPVRPSSSAVASRRVTIAFTFQEQTGKKWFGGRAEWTVLARQTGRLLPTYADDLALFSLAGGFPDEFRINRESARRAYYFNRQDWRGLIASTDRAIAQNVKDVNTYLDRANAFRQLNQPGAARAAFANARDLDDSGFYDQRITDQENQRQKSH